MTKEEWDQLKYGDIIEVINEDSKFYLPLGTKFKVEDLSKSKFSVVYGFLSKDLELFKDKEILILKMYSSYKLVDRTEDSGKNKCPICNSSALILFTSIECSNNSCKLYK